MFGTDYYSQVYPGGTSQVLEPLTLILAMANSQSSVGYSGRSDGSVSMDPDSDANGISMNPELTSVGVG